MTEVTEGRRIQQLVRNLPLNAFVDVQTPFSVRQLPHWLGGRQTDDDNGFYGVFKCTAIPGGVRITCRGRAKGWSEVTTVRPPRTL